MTQVTLNNGSVDSAGSLALKTNGTTTAVTIDTSQNVGIGTSSPAYKLDVSGDVRSTGPYAMSTNSFIYSYTGGTSGQVRSGIQFDGTNTLMCFYTAQAERARIDSNGSLLVGTTGTIGTNTKGVQMSQDGTGGYIRVGSTVNTSYTVMGFYNQSNYAGSINTLNNSTSYGTSSDYRLKENVQPMTGALSVVQQLKPCTYNWKNDGSDGQGFIAHELQEVVPDAVIGEKDAVDEEGNAKYQHIDTSFLVATLTAAIQEQQALITQLQADVAALKGN